MTFYCFKSKYDTIVFIERNRLQMIDKNHFAVLF